MTPRRRSRLARRRLKAHDRGISDRHNPGTQLLRKRERQKVERDREQWKRSRGGAP